MIRIRFIPATILKCLAAIILGPALVFGAGTLLFMYDQRWPAYLGKGIIPMMLIVLVLMVYLMMRFVIMFNADVFTSRKLIVRRFMMFRSCIPWQEISSVEMNFRESYIKIKTTGNDEYILKGFRKMTARDDLQEIDSWSTIRSSWEYRFHGLKTRVTMQQYKWKLLAHLPQEKFT